MHPTHLVEFPPVRSLLGHASRHLLEATVAPLVLFYALLNAVGLRDALLAGLGWSYAALLRRAIRRERIPGVLLLGALLLTARTLIAWLTGSVFLYLLQPTLGTFLVAGLFLASVPLRRPLAGRLAQDFCPLPEGLLANPRMHRFFLRVSLLWALVYVVNGAATLGLLLTATVGTFLVAKTVATALVTGVAIAGSMFLFRRSMAVEGVRLVLHWRAPATR